MHENVWTLFYKFLFWSANAENTFENHDLFLQKKWYFIIRWWWRWRWWFIIMMLILWETCSQFAREKKPRAKNPVMHPFPKWFSQHRYHFGTSQPVQPTKRFLLDDLSSETTATYPVRHMEKGNHLSNRFGTSFLVNLNFQNVLHQKLTYPRKINGWKMKFRFEMVPFLVDISIFARCSFILNHSKSVQCLATWQASHSLHRRSAHLKGEVAHIWGMAVFFGRKTSCAWLTFSALLHFFLLLPFFSPFLRGSVLFMREKPRWKIKAGVAGPVFLSLLLTQLLQKCRSPLFSAFPRVFFFS